MTSVIAVLGVGRINVQRQRVAVKTLGEVRFRRAAVSLSWAPPCFKRVEAGGIDWDDPEQREQLVLSSAYCSAVGSDPVAHDHCTAV
jgi:hypothetical protein